MFFSASDAKPSLEVRGVFLKLYKAFDRVWHDGLLYKIMSNGIDGNFFKLIKSFLNSRCQQIVLNGQSSVWKLVTTHVLQSLVLGPLFVLICINDLPPGLTTNVKLFADDTSLFSVVNNASLSASRLSNDLEKTQDRAFAKEVTFSKKKKKKNPGTHHSLSFSQSTNRTRHNSKSSWFKVRSSTNISIPSKQKHKKAMKERNRFSSKPAV